MNGRKQSIWLNVLLKGLAITSLVLAYLATSCLLTLIPMGARSVRSARIWNTTFFSRLALALFGVRARVKHREHLSRSTRGAGGRLVVCNHVSYIDVLVLSSLSPSVFITSMELKNTPLLGMLAAFGGSLFVERRKPSGLKQEINDIARVLEQGFSVVLFPEGTTSNGDRVQQFKNSLFDSAVSARADILPFCLRYTRINDVTLSVGSRDKIFYYGGVPFSKHFSRFLSLKSVDMDVIPLNIIKATAHTSRKELATMAHVAISKAYHA